jgi:hypothetical protein
MIDNIEKLNKMWSTEDTCFCLPLYLKSSLPLLLPFILLTHLVLLSHPVSNLVFLPHPVSNLVFLPHSVSSSFPPTPSTVPILYSYPMAPSTHSILFSYPIHLPHLVLLPHQLSPWSFYPIHYTHLASYIIHHPHLANPAQSSFPILSSYHSATPSCPTPIHLPHLCSRTTSAKPMLASYPIRCSHLFLRPPIQHVHLVLLPHPPNPSCPPTPSTIPILSSFHSATTSCSPPIHLPYFICLSSYLIHCAHLDLLLHPPTPWSGLEVISQVVNKK